MKVVIVIVIMITIMIMIMKKAFVQVVHCLKQRWKDDGVIACRGKEIATERWPGGGGDNPHGDGGGLTCW